MTKDDFLETVETIKKVIPAVYDQVKAQSDTFFIDEQLGPSYTTANLNDTFATNLPPVTGNRDLNELIDGVQASGMLAPSGGVIISKKQLSPSASGRSLSQVPSQPRLMSNAGVGTHDSPTNAALRNKNH